MEDPDENLQEYSKRIGGIMITNSNTGGVFEARRKEIVDKIHTLYGMV